MAARTLQRRPRRVVLAARASRRTPVPRVQPRYKKVGKVHHASNQMYDFSVQKVQNIKNSKDEQVFFVQKDKITKQTVWRYMSKQEYNRRFATQTPKGVVSMLAQHPDVFMHIGHAVIKNLAHFV